MENLMLYLSILISLVAFAFAAWLFMGKRQPSDNKLIAKTVADSSGRKNLLRKEYTVLARFALVAAVLILILLPSPIWKGNILTTYLWLFRI